MSSRLDVPGLHSGISQFIQQIDSSPTDVLGHSLLVMARSDVDGIAAELSRLPGPALDAWYAAGVAMLGVATELSALARVSSPGTCEHAQLVRLQANLVAAIGTLLIDRAGGLR